MLLPLLLLLSLPASKAPTAACGAPDLRLWVRSGSDSAGAAVAAGSGLLVLLGLLPMLARSCPAAAAASGGAQATAALLQEGQGRRPKGTVRSQRAAPSAYGLGAALRAAVTALGCCGLSCSRAPSSLLQLKAPKLRLLRQLGALSSGALLLPRLVPMAVRSPDLPLLQVVTEAVPGWERNGWGGLRARGQCRRE